MLRSSNESRCLKVQTILSIRHVDQLDVLHRSGTSSSTNHNHNDNDNVRDNCSSSSSSSNSSSSSSSNYQLGGVDVTAMSIDYKKNHNINDDNDKNDKNDSHNYSTRNFIEIYGDIDVGRGRKDGGGDDDEGGVRNIFSDNNDNNDKHRSTKLDNQPNQKLHFTSIDGVKSSSSIRGDSNTAVKSLESRSKASSHNASKVIAANKLVRTDASMVRIDAFYKPLVTVGNHDDDGGYDGNCNDGSGGRTRERSYEKMVGTDYRQYDEGVETKLNLIDSSRMNNNTGAYDRDGVVFDEDAADADMIYCQCIDTDDVGVNTDDKNVDDDVNGNADTINDVADASNRSPTSGDVDLLQKKKRQRDRSDRLIDMLKNNCHCCQRFKRKIKSDEKNNEANVYNDDNDDDDEVVDDTDYLLSPKGKPDTLLNNNISNNRNNENEDSIHGLRINSNSSSSTHQSNWRHSVSDIHYTTYQYQSVITLLREINEECNRDLMMIIKHNVYVGVIDCYYSLIQHGTKLYIIDHTRLIKDMFYQLVIQQFGMKKSIVFDEPIDIERCIYHALIEEELNRKNNCDIGNTYDHHHRNDNKSSSDNRINTDIAGRDDVMSSDGIDDDVRHDIREQTSIAMRLLRSKASILDEYFAIRIDITTGSLISLPCILPEYLPIPEELPGFLLDLCTEVIWDIEIDCFRSIALILATYYSKLPVVNYSIDDDVDHVSGRVATIDDDQSKQLIANSKAPQLTVVGVDLLSNYIYPALRVHLKPHKSRHTDNTVMQIAALEQLYKVFERC